MNRNGFNNQGSHRLQLNGFHNGNNGFNGNHNFHNYRPNGNNNNHHYNNQTNFLRRRTVSSDETENGHPIYRDVNSFAHNSTLNAKFLNNAKLTTSLKDEDILKIRSVDKANQTLNQYRKDNKFCDFELRVDVHSFPVHKLVLASASPYFEAMFNNKENFVETEANFTTLHDIDLKTCKIILNYIYTGEININSHNVQEISRISNMFELLELVEYCSKFMENSLSVHNCIGILRFSDFYGFQNLCYEAKRFIERYFAEVCREEEFLDLPVNLLRPFLRSENLSIDSEWQVLNSTLRWILQDTDARRPHLEEFLNLIRMPLITPKQIRKFLDSIDGDCPEPIRRALEPYVQCSPVANAESNDYQSIRSQPRMCSRRRLYVLGGQTIRSTLDRLSPHTLHTMVKFSLHTGTWEQDLNTFSYPRSSHCVAKLNDKIYLIGGECDSLILESCETFDLESTEPRWARGADLKYPRTCFGACVFDGRIYAFGGKGNQSGNTVEQYDAEHNQWTLYDKMPVPLYGMQVVATDTLIYIIGGRSNNHTRDTLTSYNPTTHEFRKLTPMNVARSDFGCTVLHGNIYVIGGLDIAGDPIAAVEQYNVTENKWAFLSSLKVRRSNLCAVAINNLIYVFGGKQLNQPRSLKSVDVYDPGCDQWYTAKPMPQNRTDSAVVLV